MLDDEAPQAESTEYLDSEGVNDTPLDPVSTNHDQAPPELLWISEGSDFVISTIYIYQDPVTRRLKTILVEPVQELKDQGMIEFPVETRWSVPSKTQLDSYRERSARFNTAARAVLVNRGMVEDFIIRNHLLEIKIGPEDNQKSVELTRDKKGALTNESMRVINKLHPSVIDLIFAKFVDEAALIL